MPMRAGSRIVGYRKLSIIALTAAALTIPLCISAYGGGSESSTSTNERFRNTLQEVWERQAFRPPAALEQRVREALRSIRETEGRTDPQLAGHLSAHLKSAWMELERSRLVGSLGYTEFNEATFQTSETRLQEIITQYFGVRASFSKARSRAALKALTDVERLSRDARRDVPGLSSEDVILAREKRWDHLWKEYKESDMERPPLTPRR